MTTQERTDNKERRSNRYPFQSQKALKEYFRDWLENPDIETCISEAAQHFRIRAGTSDEETGLQFVKKCEEALFRMLTGAPRSGNGTDLEPPNSP